MSFPWLASSLQSRRARSSERRKREQTRRRRIALESLEDRTLLSTFTWTGADAGTNPGWSDAGNWLKDGNTTATAPGVSDDVVFDSGTKSSQLDTAFTVQSVTIDSGYTGTLDLNADLTVGGSFTNKGTFDAGTSTVTFVGSHTATVDTGSGSFTTS